LDSNQQFLVSDKYTSEETYAYNRSNNTIQRIYSYLDAQGNWRDSQYGHAYGIIDFDDTGTEISRETFTAAEMRAREAP
jgi:hypothetical protein